jgi:hypothetical protein
MDRLIQISTVSDGAHLHRNDDLVEVFRHGASVADVIVMDGATSIADHDSIDQEAGDVAWFVAAFAAALGRLADPGVNQQDSIVLALERVRRDLAARLDLSCIPRYAHPLAAMTWLRMTDAGDSVHVQAYALGDCKLFVLDAQQQAHDLDSYHNPQEGILKEAIGALRKEGICDAGAIREKLLPMLRARRQFQNTNPAPDILCLDPQGPFAGRTQAFEIGKDSALVVMTDGLYRLVDTYGVCSNSELVSQCAGQGLDAVLRQLRDFERANLASGHLSVKKSDDASAAVCTFV